MKKLILLTLWVCMAMVHPTYEARGGSVVFERSPLFTLSQPGDKGAILMIHFGTTHDDTRALTIDAITTKVKNAYPELEVREAYSSRIVIKRLNDRGIAKPNPREALAQLKADGFTHVLVQATTLVNGAEMMSIQHDVEEAMEDFRELRLATPLLFYESDYEYFVQVLTKDTPSDAVHLWVGHGTYDVSTAQYAMLDHYLHSRGYHNVVIGCIEGYPYFDDALQRIQATGLRKVILQPLMIVAGDHAKADMAENYKERLEAEGFEVEVRLIGLGQLPEIQQLILDKINFYSQHRRLSIMEKKKIYEVTGEKMKEVE